jgi:hypothetical protein
MGDEPEREPESPVVESHAAIVLTRDENVTTA